MPPPLQGGLLDRPPPTGTADLLDGTPYRLIRLLGEGGMGEVFEAEHRTLGHRVVVKVLRAQYAALPEMRDRMRVEAQALARIRHPNLVMVTDFGMTASGRTYLVMELLVGCSLRERLSVHAALPVPEAVEIARQMLLGLSAAHEAGLVHRDVKPDNVFLCEDASGRPQVKILDFGVVKVAQAGRDPRTPQPVLNPTAEGLALGTPRYFSPEQALGQRDLDARSDVYAVGLVLYSMVAGRGPFDDCRLLNDLMRAHVSERPPPLSRCSAQPVPAPLERLVARALEKQRDDRFPTALIFASELRALLDSMELAGAGGHGSAGAPAIPKGASAPPGHTTTVGMPLPRSEDPTVTASPAIGGEPRPQKLSGQPVIVEGLVDRVLGAKPTMPSGTVPMQPAFTPVAPVTAQPVSEPWRSEPSPSSQPSSGEPARSSVSGTLPMIQVAPAPRPSSPTNVAPVAQAPVVQAPVATAPVASMKVAPAAALPPSLQANETLPLPTLRRPPQPPAWRVPVLAGTVILIVVIAIAAAVFLLR